MLNVKNKVIGIHTVSIGSLDSAIVSPLEVFKTAILANAASIIIAHDHPSGDLPPSPEDFKITEVLDKAFSLTGIEVLDHVIVGEEGSFCALRRDGRMPSD